MGYSAGKDEVKGGLSPALSKGEGEVEDGDEEEAAEAERKEKERTGAMAFGAIQKTVPAPGAPGAPAAAASSNGGAAATAANAANAAAGAGDGTAEPPQKPAKPVFSSHREKLLYQQVKKLQRIKDVASGAPLPSPYLDNLAPI